VTPLNVNPASHLQPYPVAGAIASVHVTPGPVSPPSLQWLGMHSFLSMHACVFVPVYPAPHVQ
jgi:hypothetical protein